MLGHEGLAFLEEKAMAAHAHPLGRAAHEAHLDARVLRVERRVVLELLDAEVGAELAVHALEQVQIEGRRQPQRIVVRSVEDARVLREVDANEKAPSLPAHSPHRSEEHRRLTSIQVADGGAREIDHGALAGGNVRRHRERPREVRV